MIAHDLKKELDALARKAENVRRRVDMLETRQPHLEEVIQRELAATVSQCAALPAGNGKSRSLGQ